MTTDEMLMYHYYENHPKLESYRWPMWCLVFYVLAGTILKLTEHKIYLWCGIVLCVIALTNMVLMMRAFCRECAFSKSLFMKLDRIPIFKIEAAESLERDLHTAWLWAIECEEGHIGGDCPLCGAK